MKKILLFLCAAFFSSGFAFADVAVTVYNSDRALVRESRDISLKKGIQTLEFDNVSSKIDATSVLPKFMSEPSKIKVLEQNFDYDLVSRDKLLSKYIGKKIEVERVGEDKRAKASGILLSVAGGVVLQTESKIILNPAGEISMRELPENLRLKPTLSWLVASQTEGANKMEISYQTSGLSWNADYVLVTDEKDENADITGWVTINNRSGATYKDAKLKVIAGDVNTLPQPRAVNRMAELKSASGFLQEDDSFVEKSFYEYHIYELQRKSTIKDNEVKQIEFISANKIPVKKVLKYEAVKNNKVTVNLEFKNAVENNLGVPLPKGRVRVCKYDGDSLEFVGENYIDHTAKNANISIYTGNAFDVSAERIRTNYKEISSKSFEESYKITLKNAKNEDVEVVVVELLNDWANWTIFENSVKYEKTDSKTAEFKVKVPKEGEAVLTYKIKYAWK
ncbi:MAG: hypothetical protein LBQ47_08430 [Endomicrobium sp.]|jgi:hypothetical protein|nr:hypothetical protein [Endomicrobium sp.]